MIYHRPDQMQLFDAASKDASEPPLVAAIRHYGARGGTGSRGQLTPHLQRLEAESIEILREVAAEFRKPVMLYSIGKDSGVMLHLARKAFFPAQPPFPFLHVDTTWKFREMICVPRPHGARARARSAGPRQSRGARPRHRSDRPRARRCIPR